MTVRLPQSRTSSPPSKDGGTVLALALVLLVCGGFLAFVTLILPNAWWLFLIIGGFGGIVSLHYLTWGRWLTRISQQSEIDDEGRNM